MREISIDGAPKIGEGAHGEVFQMDEDTIVKVYRPRVSMEEIKKEKELARWAFVKDIPTAISYDIVRVGERYGVVYEMLNARSASDYIKESKADFDEFIIKSVELLKKIHSVEVSEGELPDMKQRHISWAEECRPFLSDKQYVRLTELIDAVPDRHTLLHADYHLKNIMITGGELMLIDMDTLCFGDPLFELATIYNSYKEFPSIAPEAAMFLGIDVDTASEIWERTLDAYLGENSSSERDEITEKARILGCVRIIDYSIRHMNSKDGKLCLDVCTGDLSDLLQKKL